MKPIIFLDIDDVLCVHRTLNTREVLAALAGDETVDAAAVWQQIFHGAAVEYLRQLHFEFDAQYVISSSWTLHVTKEQLCETFMRTGLEFVAQNLHRYWCTPRDDDSYRLVEIDAWLDTHALTAPVSYLIIDDQVSGQSLVGSHLESRSVLCNAWGGFMFKELAAARHILLEQITPDRQ